MVLSERTGKTPKPGDRMRADRWSRETFATFRGTMARAAESVVDRGPLEVFATETSRTVARWRCRWSSEAAVLLGQGWGPTQRPRATRRPYARMSCSSVRNKRLV